MLCTQLSRRRADPGWRLSDGGGAGSTLDNAGTYYKNLIQHVNGGSGTPKRPGKAIETYLFAMFDENKKDGAGTEQHFGLFSPNKQPCFQLVEMGMRMYGPKSSTFEALRGSNIELVLDVPNSDLPALGFDPLATSQWVQNNVGNYFPGIKFQYIAVGNEVDPNKANTAPYVQFVLPAMKNVYNAIAALGLQGPNQGLNCNILGTSKQPIPTIARLFRRWCQVKTYALFTASGDQSGYQNLFDALLDAMYSAVEKAGGPGVEIVVSETGWPSQGHEGATKQNAETYYQNMIKHVKAGSGKISKLRQNLKLNQLKI
ncbi:unnamed protein product [Camellia sinensis]